jgi:hypothetical protein
MLPGPRLTKIGQDEYRAEYFTPDKQSKYLTISQQDFHVLGKFQLGVMIENRI